MSHGDSGVAVAQWEAAARLPSVVALTVDVREFARRHAFANTHELELGVAEAVLDAVRNDDAALTGGRIRVAAAIDAGCLSVRIAGDAPPREGRFELPLATAFANRVETAVAVQDQTSVLLEFARPAHGSAGSPRPPCAGPAWSRSRRRRR